MAQPVTLLHSKRSSFHHKAPFSRLLASLRLIFHPKTLLEEVNVPPCTTNVPDQSESFPPDSIGQSFPIDPDAQCEHLIDLVSHLQSLLPGSCEWLEQRALEVVGEHPVDAGGVADVWLGMMGNRKVAIKSYRCYSSSDYLPTYVVSGTYLWRVPLTESLSAEVLQRGTGM
jgi:hypothetical protein